MTEKYAERMKHKAERLAQISAELDALHAQAAGLLGGPHDPHEGVLLAQLADARRALAGYLPTVRAEAGEAGGTASYAADYLAHKYGSAGAGRQGGNQ